MERGTKKLSRYGASIQINFQRRFALKAQWHHFQSVLSTLNPMNTAGSCTSVCISLTWIWDLEPSVNDWATLLLHVVLTPRTGCALASIIPQLSLRTCRFWFINYVHFNRMSNYPLLHFWKFSLKGKSHHYILRAWHRRRDDGWRWGRTLDGLSAPCCYIWLWGILSRHLLISQTRSLSHRVKWLDLK